MKKFHADRFRTILLSTPYYRLAMPQNTNTVTDVENLIMSKIYLLAKYIFGGLDGKSEYIFGENRMFI